MNKLQMGLGNRPMRSMYTMIPTMVRPWQLVLLPTTGMKAWTGVGVRCAGSCSCRPAGEQSADALHSSGMADEECGQVRATPLAGGNGASWGLKSHERVTMPAGGYGMG